MQESYLTSEKEENWQNFESSIDEVSMLYIDTSVRLNFVRIAHAHFKPFWLHFRERSTLSAQLTSVYTKIKEIVFSFLLENQILLCSIKWNQRLANSDFVELQIANWNATPNKQPTCTQNYPRVSRVSLHSLTRQHICWIPNWFDLFFDKYKYIWFAWCAPINFPTVSIIIESGSWTVGSLWAYLTANKLAPLNHPFLYKSLLLISLTLSLSPTQSFSLLFDFNFILYYWRITVYKLRKAHNTITWMVVTY